MRKLQIYRLISPCIDVPLACVKVERTDSLEFIPSMVTGASNGRKPSSGSHPGTGWQFATGTAGKRTYGVTNGRGSGGGALTMDDGSSGPYSPMHPMPLKKFNTDAFGDHKVSSSHLRILTSFCVGVSCWSGGRWN